jgi:hypothetical protein
MSKLTRATHLHDRVIRLEFSDGSWGDYDIEPLLERGGPTVEPLRDPTYFKRFFLDDGALAWPNGLDLSAEAVHRRMAEARSLQRPRAAE